MFLGLLALALLALIFGLATAAKWLFIVAVVLLVLGAFSGYNGYNRRL